MNRQRWLCGATALAALALVAGCSSMNRQEKGTAVGATSGAVAGAVVGGPVGAAVGAGVGGYVGHEGTGPDRARTARGASAGDAMPAHDATMVRSAQQALNQRGYDVGAVDGQWGPTTERAVREFQQANGLPQTGDLNAQTLSALGVSR